MTPTAAPDLAAAIDAEFPPLNPESAQTVIHGIETLSAPDVALGATPAPAAQPAVPDPAAPAPAPAPAASNDPSKPLTIEERIAQDEELAKHIEAERSRAVTGYIKKRDTEDFQKRLQADRETQQKTLIELAQKAEAGDETAKEQLLNNQVAKILGKYSATEVSQAWVNELIAATAAVAGDDTEALNKLDLSHFKNVPEWAQAAVEVATAKSLAAEQTKFEAERQKWQADLDKLAEAKAIDIVAGRRGSLAAAEPHLTDLNQPAGFGVASAGGWRQGDWKTYAEACRQWNDGVINDNEMALARKLYDEKRIPIGALGVD